MIKKAIVLTALCALLPPVVAEAQTLDRVPADGSRSATVPSAQQRGDPVERGTTGAAQGALGGAASGAIGGALLGPPGIAAGAAAGAAQGAARGGATGAAGAAAPHASDD